MSPTGADRHDDLNVADTGEAELPAGADRVVRRNGPPEHLEEC